MTQRTLVVVRHSKAEQSGTPDFERHLAERGHGDAADAGRWLAAQGIGPDAALVSSSVRTVETWTDMAEAAGWDLEADFDRGLYSAGPETALDLVRLTPSETTTLVVVGHNPTMASLAQMLDDGEGDPEVAGRMNEDGFATSAVAVFTFDGEWADLDMGTATLVAFHVGRG